MLLAKRELKMGGGGGGYYLPSFLFCVFVDREGVEVHKQAITEQRGQYPAILAEQAWSITAAPTHFAGKSRTIPSEQDRPI